MLRVARLLLLLAALLLMGWRLGSGSLRDWDESLTAERSREMRETGDFFTPRLAGEPDFNKPPLYYALTALMFSVTGENELGVRFWSVALSLLALLSLERLGTRLGGSPWIGLLAAALLLSNPHWVNRTREGLLDSGMVLGLVAGWYLLLAGPGKRVRPLLAGLVIGLCMLIKNPLPIAALGLAAAMPADSRVRRSDLLRAGVVALAVGLSWYVAQAVVHRDAFLAVFIKHNVVGRATAAIDMKTRPPVYYLIQMWKLAPAACLWFPVSLLALPIWRSRQQAARLPVLVALSIVLLLMCLVSKRDVYLLLAYPFMALGAALIASQLPSQRGRIAAVALMLTISLGCFAPRYLPVLDFSPSFKDAARELRTRTPADALVLSTHLPVATAMFYAGRPAFFTWLQPFPAVLVRTGYRPGRPVVLVTRPGRAAADAVQMAAAIGGTRLAPVYKNREFVVLSSAASAVLP